MAGSERDDERINGDPAHILLTGDVELHTNMAISADVDMNKVDVRTWLQVVVTGGVGLEDGEQHPVGLPYS